MVLATRPADAAHADPVTDAARQGYLATVARDADAAWADLQAQLEAALEAARNGAALIVSGDQPPAEPLLQAAERLQEGGGAASQAGYLAERLRGVLASVRPAVEAAVPQLPSAADLASIGAQLRDSADAATPFLQRRHAAEDCLTHLGRALGALDAGDPDAAQEALDAAAAARQVLVDWTPPPLTLGLWLETTGSMIDAGQRIIVGTRDGDPATVRKAVHEYAVAAANARRADISLGLSLSETGGGLTATPLRRLAEALAAVEEARSLAIGLGQ